MHSFAEEVLDLVAASLDALTALVIVFGLLALLGRALRALRTASGLSAAVLSELRLTLGRWLALALELTLASDVLQTVMVPSWDALGKLAAIAALRTALNYALQREIEQGAGEERVVHGAAAGA